MTDKDEMTNKDEKILNQIQDLWNQLSDKTVRMSVAAGILHQLNFDERARVVLAVERRKNPELELVAELVGAIEATVKDLKPMPRRRSETLEAS